MIFILEPYLIVLILFPVHVLPEQGLQDWILERRIRSTTLPPRHWRFYPLLKPDQKGKHLIIYIKLQRRHK